MSGTAEDIRLLVARCLGGDQRAMVAYVDRYREVVFRLCYRMLGQRQDAEDAAQETFLRALRSLARWDPSRRMEPWLMTIAGNRCRSMLAARKRRPWSRELLHAEVAEDVGARADAEHLAEELQRALQQIRPEHREAFLMFHEQQLSYEEIAQCLDRPLGTVKTWIRRARGELAAQLRRRQVLAVR